MIPADTHEDFYHKQREMWFAKTPGERFIAGLQMMDDSKALVEAGIRLRNPGMSEVDVKMEWFKMMYKDDFNTDELNHITEQLRLYHAKKS
jgi:hypothetical protein